MSIQPSELLIVDSREDVRVAFLGRAADPDAQADLGLDAALARLRRALGEGSPARGAENRQVHSSRILEASFGARREADALWSRERDLALAVYTADCVPVLLAGPTAVAAAHAGWRGLAAGVLDATLEGLPDPPRALTAWIGPSIGACCYEVSEEVALAVAIASSSRARVERDPRPHLDLPEAARSQLAHAGVRDVRLFLRCTSCEQDRLWSYRRQGGTGRRNYALVWRSSGPAKPRGSRAKARN